MGKGFKISAIKTHLCSLPRVMRNYSASIVVVVVVVVVTAIIIVVIVINVNVIMWTGPSDEDLESFVSYVIQLIHGCDLERVSLLLRFIQRFVILTRCYHN